MLLTFLYKVLFPVLWTPAHGIFYHYPFYWHHNIQAGWPSGMRHWFKASVNLVPWDQDPLLSFMLTSYTKSCFLYFENLQMVSSLIIHAFDCKKYRQDGRVVRGAGLRHQSHGWRGFVTHPCYVVDIPIQSIVSFILNTCTCYLLP